MTAEDGNLRRWRRVPRQSIGGAVAVALAAAKGPARYRAAGAFWILVSVLFFGTAMDKTGLARRISYRILLIFRPTYAGILTAFMLIGFILTLGVPSMTVRTANRLFQDASHVNTVSARKVPIETAGRLGAS